MYLFTRHLDVNKRDEKHRLWLENDSVVIDQRCFFCTSTQKFTLTNTSIKKCYPPPKNYMYIKMNLWTRFVFYTQFSPTEDKKIAF